MWPNSAAVFNDGAGLSSLHHGSSDCVSVRVAEWALHPGCLSGGHADCRAAQCVSMAPQAATQAYRLPGVAQNTMFAFGPPIDGEKQATRYFVIQPPRSFFNPGFLRTDSTTHANSVRLARLGHRVLPNSVPCAGTAFTELTANPLRSLKPRHNAGIPQPVLSLHVPRRTA